MIAETTPQNIRDPIQSNLNKTPIFEDDPNYDADVTDDDYETEYEDEYEDESQDDAEDEYEDESKDNAEDESQDEAEDESQDDHDDEDKSPDVADGEDKSPDVADDEDKSPDVDDAEDKSPDVDDAEDESEDDVVADDESQVDAEDKSPDVDDAEDESEDDVVADDESQVDVEDKTPDEAEGEDEDEDNHEDAQEVDEETASDSEESKEINIQKPEPVSETESDSESDDNERVDVEAAMTQKELQKTDPTIVHTETNANFYYLSHKCEDSEHLTPKYTKEVPKEGINVILYLYTICDHHYMSPFVSLLLEYNVKESYYDFPQLLYTTDIQTDDIHDAILEKSLQKIYEIFDVKATEKVDTNLFQQKHICYKGLLEMNEDNVILCIDVSTFLSHLKQDEVHLSKVFSHTSDTPSSYTWSVVDEVLRQKIQNIPISPVIGKFVFSEEHDYLLYIRKDGQKIQHPKLLYHCVLPEEGVDGVDGDISVKFETNIPEHDDTIHLITETAVHPKIGEMIYFSEDPIQEDAYKNIQKLDRYVVFVDNPIEFKGKPDTWDLTQINMGSLESQIESNEDIMDAFETKDDGSPSNEKSINEKSIKEIKTAYSSVTFQQNDRKIYGIKSPNFFCIL
jgi:hypothetical protein